MAKTASAWRRPAAASLGGERAGLTHRLAPPGRCGSGGPAVRTWRPLPRVQFLVFLALKFQDGLPMGRMMKKILLIIGAVAVLLLAGWAVKAFTTVQAKARNSRLSTDIESLFDGLQKYKEFVGTYPAGGNAEIAKALQGENPRKVTVLVGRKLQVNGKGEYVDPWGTPMRIYFSGDSVLIRSAGPNRWLDAGTTIEFDDCLRSN